MHLEVLVEDTSGKAALDVLVPKIIGSQHTFRVRAYKGSGHIPRNLASSANANHRLLLDRLPKLLRGYGKRLAGYPADYEEAVVVVCDLDDKCLKAFRQELFAMLNACSPRPKTRFCIAIEEGEAWLLGDVPAIKAAYPEARDGVLNRYQNDAICGTWELLADAIHPGGSSGLKRNGWRAVGREKSTWSENITPRMDVDTNASPSFQYFRRALRQLASTSTPYRHG